MYTIILMTPAAGFSFLQFNNLFSAQQRFNDLTALFAAGQASALFAYDPNGVLVDKRVA